MKTGCRCRSTCSGSFFLPYLIYKSVSALWAWRRLFLLEFLSPVFSDFFRFLPIRAIWGRGCRLHLPVLLSKLHISQRRRSSCLDSSRPALSSGTLARRMDGPFLSLPLPHFCGRFLPVSKIMQERRRSWYVCGQV